ncbi:hypothetical protein SIID45300_00129 [Candidatus Magnetaquicoccaceae bacterium FCR-1]|uniref:TIGR01620 family protein n=1 Tax=Candidatus Magnetaquiglobus chichijimensis TaxID=3141448 RepID=A0ABQ0C4N1_9PROT
MRSRPTWTAPVELSPDPLIADSPRVTPTFQPPTEAEPVKEEEPGNGFSDPLPPLGESPGAAGSGRRWRWFFWSFFLLLAGILIEESVLFLVEQFRLHVGLGLFFSGLVGVLISVLISALLRELRGLKAIRAQDGQRAEAARLMAEDGFGNAQPLLRRLVDQHAERPELRDALEAFRALNQAHLGDREALTLFSQRALKPLDEAALRIIGKHAASAAFLAVLSPLALLDALLFFWRNLRMMREIAQVYGLRPGPAGTFVLMRHVAEGMLAAGSGDVLAKSAAEALGDTLTGAALAGAGQAATNALFTARVGLRCLRLCRPIPFPKADEPGLGRIRRELKAALTGPKG